MGKESLRWGVLLALWVLGVWAVNAERLEFATRQAVCSDFTSEFSEVTFPGPRTCFRLRRLRRSTDKLGYVCLKVVVDKSRLCIRATFGITQEPWFFTKVAFAARSNCDGFARNGKLGNGKSIFDRARDFAPSLQTKKTQLVFCFDRISAEESCCENPLCMVSFANMKRADMPERRLAIVGDKPRKCALSTVGGFPGAPRCEAELSCADVATDTPTPAPTEAPTEAATEAATGAPTNAPTDAPTSTPSNVPTEAPTDAPTPSPTNAPTDAPTQAPTETPTQAPTETPTQAPTDAPTPEPTDAPTPSPTDAPTDAPTQAPTDAPTPEPTDAPTASPTPSPTAGPTQPPIDSFFYGFQSVVSWQTGQADVSWYPYAAAIEFEVFYFLGSVNLDGVQNVGVLRRESEGSEIVDGDEVAVSITGLEVMETYTFFLIAREASGETLFVARGEEAKIADIEAVMQPGVNVFNLFEQEIKYGFAEEGGAMTIRGPGTASLTVDVGDVLQGIAAPTFSGEDADSFFVRVVQIVSGLGTNNLKLNVAPGSVADLYEQIQISGVLNILDEETAVPGASRRAVSRKQMMDSSIARQEVEGGLPIGAKFGPIAVSFPVGAVSLDMEVVLEVNLRIKLNDLRILLNIVRKMDLEWSGTANVAANFALKTFSEGPSRTKDVEIPFFNGPIIPGFIGPVPITVSPKWFFFANWSIDSLVIMLSVPRTYNFDGFLRYEILKGFERGSLGGANEADRNRDSLELDVLVAISGEFGVGFLFDIKFLGIAGVSPVLKTKIKADAEADVLNSGKWSVSSFGLILTKFEAKLLLDIDLQFRVAFVNRPVVKINLFSLTLLTLLKLPEVTRFEGRGVRCEGGNQFVEITAKTKDGIWAKPVDPQKWDTLFISDSVFIIGGQESSKVQLRIDFDGSNNPIANDSTLLGYVIKPSIPGLSTRVFRESRMHDIEFEAIPKCCADDSDCELGEKCEKSICVKEPEEGEEPLPPCTNCNPPPGGFTGGGSLTGGATGDPHLTSFDGRRYSCQGEGEFILAQDEVTGVAVHAVFESRVGPVSLTRGVVLQDIGGDLLQVFTTGPGSFDCTLRFAKNGVEIDPEDAEAMAAAGFTPSMGNARGVIQVPGLPIRVEFNEFDCFLWNLFVVVTDLNNPIAQRMRGLLGTPNRFAKDDWLLRDGTPLTFFEELTYKYCTAVWCIRDVDESIYTYLDGSFDESNMCDKPESPPINLNDATQEMRDVCGANEECLTDAIWSGNAETGGVTLQAEVDLQLAQQSNSIMTVSPGEATLGEITPLTITVDLKAESLALRSFVNGFRLYFFDPVTETRTGGDILFLFEFSDPGIFTNVYNYSPTGVMAGESVGFVAVPIVNDATVRDVLEPYFTVTAPNAVLILPAPPVVDFPVENLQFYINPDDTRAIDYEVNGVKVDVSMATGVPELAIDTRSVVVRPGYVSGIGFFNGKSVQFSWTGSGNTVVIRVAFRSGLGQVITLRGLNARAAVAPESDEEKLPQTPASEADGPASRQSSTAGRFSVEVENCFGERVDPMSYDVILSSTTREFFGAVRTGTGRYEVTFPTVSAAGRSEAAAIDEICTVLNRSDEICSFVSALDGPGWGCDELAAAVQMSPPTNAEMSSDDIRDLCINISEKPKLFCEPTGAALCDKLRDGEGTAVDYFNPGRTTLQFIAVYGGISVTSAFVAFEPSETLSGAVTVSGPDSYEIPILVISPSRLVAKQSYRVTAVAQCAQEGTVEIRVRGSDGLNVLKECEGVVGSTPCELVVRGAPAGTTDTINVLIFKLGDLFFSRTLTVTF